jgi:peptidyl-prolyl cis-trans isomerase B (cyclophilin B)
MRKRRILAVTATTLAFGLVGVTSSSASTAVSAGVASPGPAAGGPGAAATRPCTFTRSVPADRFKGLPMPSAAQVAKAYSATLHTTQGSITFDALTAKAPCTSYSFRFLAAREYFDRTHCHRLTLKGIFVLQCGDPTGTGSGAPGYKFPDENLAGATYPAGTVAMANAGPNTNGSQFFFTWANTQLSPNYTPFGKVTAGLDVLRRIAAEGDDSQNGPGDGYPNVFVEFNRITITFGS